MATMDLLTYISSLPALVYLSTLTVALCVVLHYLVYWRRTAQWRKSNIPFLPPSFAIGHKYFWSMISNPWLVPIDRIYRENKDKDVVGFFMAARPMILIRNPAIIKQTLVKSFDKGLPVTHSDEVARNMLALTADKDVWRAGRKTLTPMYSTTRFSGDRFTKITEQIHRMWAYTEQDRLQGKPLDMIKMTTSFLFDGISKSFFDLDANSHEKKGELLEIVQPAPEPTLIELLKSMIKLHLQRVKGFKSRNLIPQDTAESMKNLIQTQVRRRAQTKTNESDFIDHLIRLKEESGEKTSSSEMDITNEITGFGFSILFGVGIAVTGANNGIAGAGTENEYLPGSAMHLLSLYPEHQERIRQEVEEAMKKHNTTEFTYDVVQDLQFLRQCLHETARLYPTATVMIRICEEDFKIPGTDCTFKKDETLVIDPYSIHRDPKYFENPDIFNPDRFSPENKGAIAPETFLTFGNGTRKCPGKNIALLLISAMIGSLVYKYEVKPRSHLKQMDISDFHPRSLGIRPKDEFLFDILPRLVTVR